MRFLSILSILLITLQTKAQEVTLGPVNKAKGFSLVHELRKDENNLYKLQISTKGYYILHKYDLNSKLLKTANYYPKKQVPKNAVYVSFEITDKGLELVYEITDKKTKKVSLYRQTINKSDLTTSKDDKYKIAEIIGGKKRMSGFARYANEDFIIFRGTTYLGSDAKSKETFICMDKNMNEKWRNQVTAPFIEENYGIRNYIISKEGDFYESCYEWYERKERKEKDRAHKSYIRKVNRNTSKVEPINYKAQVTDVRLIENPKNGDITLVGLFSFDEANEARGIFYAEIDKALNFKKSIKAKEFTPEFISRHKKDYVQERTEKKEAKAKAKGKIKKLPSLYEFKIDELHYLENGNLVAIGQQSFGEWVTTTYTDANGNFRTRSTYYERRNYIGAFGFDLAGNLIWDAKIPKIQSEANMVFHGDYQSTFAGDKIYLVFNDTKRNYEGNSKVYPMTAARKSNVLSMVTLSTKSGKWDKKKIYSAITSKQISLPLEGLSDGKTLYVPTLRKKEHSILKILITGN